MIIHYKCANCGSDMRFDADTGALTCHSCGRQDDVETFPEDLRSASFTDEEAKEYECANCGAALITTLDTTATQCSFCGSSVTLADRLSGHLAPAKVIPFTVSKEEAIQAFKKWCRNGLLTPKGFMTADRIKSLTGIYVPFWLYDLNSAADVAATCTRVRTYSRGDYIYTETSYYEAYRKINLDYVKVPVDASEKMNDELMDKLEPYPYDHLKEFRTPYLAGYLAEKYNYSDDELLPRAKEKINDFIEDYIRSTFSGYHSVHYRQKQVDTKNVRSYYVLLPVWIVSYDYNQTEHIFAMNGQTGKVVGKPPLSVGKMAAWFGGVAASALFALKCVSFVMGGGFW